MDQLLSKFRDFGSVTLSLQRDSTTCAEVRALFDGVTTAYPRTRNRLPPNSSIIHNPDFETGVVKLQENRFKELTTAESTALSGLRISNRSSLPEVNYEGLSFADKVLKRHHVEFLKVLL